MTFSPLSHCVASLLLAAITAVHASADAPAGPQPPTVLLRGSKNLADVPGGAGTLYLDPAEASDAADHRFAYAPRGEGKLKGVDVFRDLIYQAPKHPPRRLFEGHVIGAAPLHLASGRLLVTFHAADPERVRQAASGSRPEFGIFDVRVMYSDDGGATWALSDDRLSAPAAPSGTNYGAVEPTMFPLRDGRLWMLIRTQTGRLYESFSTDAGKTWSRAVATALISSDSPAERVRLPDGRIVLLLNGCQHWDDPHAYAHGGRYVLHAAISRDEGQTWRGFREVVRARETGYAKGDHGTAYPYASATVDGQLIVGTGQAKENVVLLRIDPNWLELRTSGDDFSGGRDAWHVTKAGVRLTQTDAGAALAVGGGSGEELSEAVWNFPAGAAGSLTLRVTPTAHMNASAISLTDHFSPPGDKKAVDNGLWSFPLSRAELGLVTGRACELRLDWTVDGECSIVVNGNRHAAARRPRETLGASYLRVRAAGAGGEPGLLIHSVTAKVE